MSALPFEPPEREPGESGLRELPEPARLLKARDREPIMWVPAETWHCPFCSQPGGDGAGTTVVWLHGTYPLEGPDGRCRECGQLFVLARQGEAVPTPDEQVRDLERGAE